MSLKEQRYICTLADCGSITEAAKQLYITQPALSMFISTTERALGTKLFDRSGKTLKLTYAGELYVQHARKMIAIQDELEASLSDICDGIAGRVRIGLQRKRSTTLTVNIIKEFRKRYPNVELQFSLGEWTSLLKRYEENHIDVLIYNDQVGVDEKEGEILSDELVLLTVSRTDPVIGSSIYIPNKNYRWVDIHEVDETFILSPPGASLRNDIEVLCRKNSYQIARYREIAHIETAMQLASEGIGVCFTRESYAAQFRYIKMPTFLMVGDPILTSPLCMRYNHNLLEHEYFVYLLDVIRQSVSRSITSNIFS